MPPLNLKLYFYFIYLHSAPRVQRREKDRRVLVGCTHPPLPEVPDEGLSFY